MTTCTWYQNAPSSITYSTNTRTWSRITEKLNSILYTVQVAPLVDVADCLVFKELPAWYSSSATTLSQLQLWIITLHMNSAGSNRHLLLFCRFGSEPLHAVQNLREFFEVHSLMWRSDLHQDVVISIKLLRWPISQNPWGFLTSSHRPGSCSSRALCRGYGSAYVRGRDTVSWWLYQSREAAAPRNSTSMI